MSAISIDSRGERAIVNYRDDRLATARPDDPATLVARADAVLADNRFPEFALPICAAARARGIPVVLDADKPTQMTDRLLGKGVSPGTGTTFSHPFAWAPFVLIGDGLRLPEAGPNS